MKKDELVYIPVERLMPHPDNPRKELGDLSELAESIKVKGVMQNLTVVPYKSVLKPHLKFDNQYTIIIGHRRHAAAKLAGVETLPCIITEMSQQEQISTMLLENMQRCDLTYYEQAQGFQMMIDLGDTVENVSEKTGLSESTVRRRLKLLELDEDKIKAAESRGATLFDFMELDKIKDIKLKNQVLEHIGTENFNYQLKRAISDEEKKAYLERTEAEVSEFAEKIDDSTGYTWVTNYETWNKRKVVVPDDADEVQYYYRRTSGYITIYTKNVEDDVDEEEERVKEEREAEIENRVNSLKECSVRAFELRKEAINCMSNSHAQKHLTDIIIFIMKNLPYGYTYCPRYADEACDFDRKDEAYKELDDNSLNAYIDNLIETKTKEKPALTLLKLAYALIEDSEERRYYTSRAMHTSCKKLDMLYDFLCKLGYEMADEEKALQNGKHELFITEDYYEQM